MQSTEIYILTGPIHSGKTTAIIEWSRGRNDVYGIVTPLVETSRVFMNIQTTETFTMEASAEEADVLTVGKYIFSKPSFDRAANIIGQSLHLNSGWVVIDECGPIELRGEGFYNVIKQAVSIITPDLRILLVVRNTILKDVLDLFALEEANIHIIDTSFFTH